MPRPVVFVEESESFDLEHSVVTVNKKHFVRAFYVHHISGIDRNSVMRWWCTRSRCYLYLVPSAFHETMYGFFKRTMFFRSIETGWAPGKPFELNPVSVFIRFCTVTTVSISGAGRTFGIPSMKVAFCCTVSRRFFFFGVPELPGSSSSSALSEANNQLFIVSISKDRSKLRITICSCLIWGTIVWFRVPIGQSRCFRGIFYITIQLKQLKNVIPFVDSWRPEQQTNMIGCHKEVNIWGTYLALANSATAASTDQSRTCTR